MTTLSRRQQQQFKQRVPNCGLAYLIARFASDQALQTLWSLLLLLAG
jgi:hypothetical protein